jgi:hypothetical protein
MAYHRQVVRSAAVGSAGCNFSNSSRNEIAANDADSNDNLFSSESLLNNSVYYTWHVMLLCSANGSFLTNTVTNKINNHLVGCVATPNAVVRLVHIGFLAGGLNTTTQAACRGHRAH